MSSKISTLPQGVYDSLKLKRYRFITYTIDYLGYVKRLRRMKTAIHAADAIKHLQNPRNLTKLRSFLELHNVFRRFVVSLTLIAALPNRKLQKDKPVEVGPINEE